MSFMFLTDLQCMVEFDGQQVIIEKCIPKPGQVLIGGVQDGDLCKLPVDPVEQVW